LSSDMKQRLILLLVFIGIDYLGFVNEAMNCKKMLKHYPTFPFHAIIEVFILIAVYFFCDTFYKI
jgi:phage-related holin